MSSARINPQATSTNSILKSILKSKPSSSPCTKGVSFSECEEIFLYRVESDENQQVPLNENFSGMTEHNSAENDSSEKLSYQK
ncbi:MAG: hypothetical protein P4M12_12455 [Gammaproteobacteria bacterium]|nr:hypothetical protein [Gammaproteobacteria bacterium]